MKLIVGKCYKATCESDNRGYWWVNINNGHDASEKYFYGTPFIVLNFEHTGYALELKIFCCDKILFAQFDPQSFKFEEL